MIESSFQQFDRRDIVAGMAWVTRYYQDDQTFKAGAGKVAYETPHGV